MVELTREYIFSVFLFVYIYFLHSNTLHKISSVVVYVVVYVVVFVVVFVVMFFVVAVTVVVVVVIVFVVIFVDAAVLVALSSVIRHVHTVQIQINFIIHFSFNGSVRSVTSVVDSSNLLSNKIR